MFCVSARPSTHRGGTHKILWKRHQKFHILNIFFQCSWVSEHGESDGVVGFSVACLLEERRPFLFSPYAYFSMFKSAFSQCLKTVTLPFKRGKSAGMISFLIGQFLRELHFGLCFCPCLKVWGRRSTKPLVFQIKNLRIAQCFNTFMGFKQRRI